MEGFYNTQGDTMDYILHKLILGNKDKTDLQFIVQLLELSEKVFKTALSKKA